MKKLDPKEQILKERGLRHVQPDKHKQQRMAPATKPVIANKTTLMKYLEGKYKVRMEDVLMSGSLSVVKKKLGNEINTATISKWIKRYKLRYTADNLPQCLCPSHSPVCDNGLCIILMDMELWDLVPVKKAEILKEMKVTNV